MEGDKIFLVWIWVIAQRMSSVWRNFVRIVAVEVAKICPRCVCCEYQKIVNGVEKIEFNQRQMYEAYLEQCRRGAIFQKAFLALSATSSAIVVYDHAGKSGKDRSAGGSAGSAAASSTSSAAAASSSAAK